LSRIPPSLAEPPLRRKTALLLRLYEFLLRAKKSKAMVVLISPDSMRSKHVRQEIEYALGDPNYEGRVFPVEIRPTEDVPWILRKLKTIDGRQNPAKVSESIAIALKQVA